jgi:hypothetical protein
MPLSPRFLALRTRIESLKTRFLQFENAYSFDFENQDKLMSFRLLVHAEIEYFIEEYARVIVNTFLNNWTTRGNILPGLRYLFVYSPTKFESPNFVNINDRIRSCCQAFIARIDNNHGIKQKNIIALFVPLGVTQAYLDNGWLATMDSFGTRRGSYAHKSVSVQTQIDKHTELNDLKIVLDGIKRVDVKLQELTKTNLQKPF